MHQNRIDVDEMLRFLYDLCAVKTVNGAEGCENAGAEFIYERLSGLGYFKKHPECLFLQPVEGDLLGRHNVVALLKASRPTKRTIILSGHIDTVDTEVCGALKDLAFDVPAYTSALKKSDNMTIARELASGDYAAGRGIADMKSGLAVQWAAVKYYAENPDRLLANLLYIPVIDEENNANGIHQAIRYFRELEGEGYELLCCVDSEPTITPESKECGRVYLGTIGMLTPFVLAVGKESHVGEYYEGISAALLAFHLGVSVENNPAFTDVYRGKAYPPICLLRTTDFRKSYSVTVPKSFGMYFNYLFVDKRPGEILDLVRILALESSQKALSQIGRGQMKASVVTFEQLCKDYAAKTGKDPERELNAFIRGCTDGEKDIEDLCLEFVNGMAAELELEGPAFVIGFLPPYCPSRVNRRESAAELRVESIAKALIAKRKALGVEIALDEVYEGISDLSELGFQGDGEDIRVLEKNLMGLNATTSYSFGDMKSLDIPVVNIGAIGKDAHKLGERLYLPYYREVLPDLLLDFIEELQK